MLLIRPQVFSQPHLIVGADLEKIGPNDVLDGSKKVDPYPVPKVRKCIDGLILLITLSVSHFAIA